MIVTFRGLFMQLWAYTWGKLRYKQISDNGPKKKKKKLPESSSQAKMQGSSDAGELIP